MIEKIYQDFSKAFDVVGVISTKTYLEALKTYQKEVPHDL